MNFKRFGAFIVFLGIAFLLLAYFFHASAEKLESSSNLLLDSDRIAFEAKKVSAKLHFWAGLIVTYLGIAIMFSAKKEIL